MEARPPRVLGGRSRGEGILRFAAAEIGRMQLVLAKQALEGGTQHPRVLGGARDVSAVTSQEVFEVRALERLDHQALGVSEPTVGARAGVGPAHPCEGVLGDVRAPIRRRARCTAWSSRSGSTGLSR